MAEAPVARKRAVPASRPKPVAKPRTRRVAPVIEEEEAPTTNFALRITEELEDEPVQEATFEMRLSKALEAITAAQDDAELPPVVEPNVTSSKSGVNTWLAAIDKLPPIRLPIGPAIPWRLGLPVLVVLIIGMGLLSRMGSQADSSMVQLPAPTPAPQTSLFATPTAIPTDAPAPTFGQDDAAQQQQQQPSQPIAAQDPGGFSFDLADIGIKLLAVLALAYGSLMVLKRIGFGGAGSARGSGGAGYQVKVVSSMALAPNRSVHVIQVPGGKTLLVGATPNSVNLLADLGQSDD